MTRAALVTLAIGAEYAERFERLCRPGWAAYAERHGFDLIVFKTPLDASARAQSRSPAWQKCLILGEPEVARYDRAVWVDSDILINPAAPSILDGVPQDRIGVIDEHAYPSLQLRARLLDDIVAAAPDTGDADKRFWSTWRDPGTWHAYFGLAGGQAHIVQTGVMVLSRQHRELLEHVYRSYEDPGPKTFNYEMRPLSHEIQRAHLPHWIDPRFNALIWWLFLLRHGAYRMPGDMPRFVSDSYRDNYFLHFAGAAHLMPLLTMTPTGM